MLRVNTHVLVFSMLAGDIHASNVRRARSRPFPRLYNPSRQSRQGHQALRSVCGDPWHVWAAAYLADFVRPYRGPSIHHAVGHEAQVHDHRPRQGKSRPTLHVSLPPAVSTLLHASVAGENAVEHD